MSDEKKPLFSTAAKIAIPAVAVFYMVRTFVRTFGYVFALTWCLKTLGISLFADFGFEKIFALALLVSIIYKAIDSIINRPSTNSNLM